MSPLTPVTEQIRKLDATIAPKFEVPSPHYKLTSATAPDSYFGDIQELLDDPFLQTLDNLTHQFVKSIQKLKAYKEQNRMEEFISATSAISARADAIVEEVRGYYLFENVPETVVVPGTENSTVKKVLTTKCEEVLLLAEEITLRGKLASGVWPPPNAAQEMLMATIPCVAAIKSLTTFAKDSTILIRKTEDSQRRKIENWRQEWLQNERVRTLFETWEKSQTSTLQV
jgi:hypothetical protein